MKKIVFLLFIIFLVIGCSTDHRINGTPVKSDIDYLVIMELGLRNATQYVYLPNDYGFLIYWPDYEEAELYTYDIIGTDPIIDTVSFS